MTLSKEAAELVSAGRKALHPGDADRARVRELLMQRIGTASTDAPIEQAALPNRMPNMGSIGLPKLLFGITGLGAAVAALMFAVYEPRATTGEVAAPAAMPVPSAPALLPAPATNSDGASTGLEASPAEAAKPATAVTSAEDRLREEVALLTRAQKEFQARRFSSALALVDEHRRKFAKGRLVQERVTLRTRLLCALGRTAEAELEQARLRRQEPGSAATQLSVCGNSSKN